MTKRRSPEERIEQLEWALQRISDVCCYQTHQNPTDDLAVINNLVGMVRPRKGERRRKWEVLRALAVQEGRQSEELFTSKDVHPAHVLARMLLNGER